MNPDTIYPKMIEMEVSVKEFGSMHNVGAYLHPLIPICSKND